MMHTAASAERTSADGTHNKREKNDNQESESNFSIKQQSLDRVTAIVTNNHTF